MDDIQIQDTLDDAQIQDTIKKYDKSERTRELTGILKHITSIIAIFMALYHLYTAWKGTPVAIVHRSIHVCLTLVLIFILYPLTKEERPWHKVINVIFIILSLIPFIYLKTNFNEIIMRPGMPILTDIIIGGILIVTVIEATRRVSGLVLPILSTLFLLYDFFGNNISGYFSHKGFNIFEVFEYMYLTTEGIYGVSIGVSAQYLILFIIFGAFLLKSGVGDFITELAISIAGDKRGGPAQVAVLSSALMGSINGSAVANVATTGSFTIPLMKKIGYTPEFAGAVEAAASCGGQILPPVMGASAFIMAEILGEKYVNIMYAAIIPALLYYFGIFMTVYLRAVRRNLKSLDKSEIPRLGEVLKKKFYLLTPLIVLVYLMIKGYTPTYAAFFGIILTIPVSWLNRETRMSFKDILEALEAGAKGAISVAATCAIVGIIVGVSTQTGFGSKVAGGIISLSGGNIILTLIFTMFACLILGMGMPSIPAYILTANMAVPALLKLGIQPLVSHFFVFFFAIMANITPPVALASFAAAGISGGDMNKTGIEGFKLALAGFIIPYMFVFNPVLLGFGKTYAEIIIASITAFVGVGALSTAVEGYFLTLSNKIERLLLLAAGLLLIKAGLTTDLIGLVIIVTISLFQIKRKKIIALDEKMPS